MFLKESAICSLTKGLVNERSIDEHVLFILIIIISIVDN